MRTSAEIEERERLIAEFKINGYSWHSIAYIVNTYYVKGIEKHWDELTKKIIHKITGAAK